MRIGFITYEYPPDIAQGGIATYVQQAAKMLLSMGHSVEVFCASNHRSISELVEGVLIHRCIAADANEFRINCVGIFSQRHDLTPFDVIESPEIHGNAYNIKIKYPSLPMVVKLHMPLFLQMRLLNYYTPLTTKIHFFLGALRRGRINKFGNYHFEEDIDYKIAKLANGIVSPSISLKKIIEKEWEIEAGKIESIPYPFNPPKVLLDLPINSGNKNTISFIGKLSVHKGLVNLVKVISIVAKKNPDVVFNLIGNDSYFSIKKMTMSAYIVQQLKGFEKNYIIKGGLNYVEVMEELKYTSICIFPSIWENFPLVCLEAMSAGKAVIGSKEGGMNEMLADGVGVIINPLNHHQMANAILELIRDNDLVKGFGEKARRKVLEEYSSKKIGKMLEEYFQTVLSE